MIDCGGLSAQGKAYGVHIFEPEVRGEITGSEQHFDHGTTASPLLRPPFRQQTPYKVRSALYAINPESSRFLFSTGEWNMCQIKTKRRSCQAGFLPSSSSTPKRHCKGSSRVVMNSVRSTECIDWSLHIIYSGPKAGTDPAPLH